MKFRIALILSIPILISCRQHPTADTAKPTSAAMTGTWQLISGTTIENGDTSVTDYTKNISFIKIINDTHFAFLQHDLNRGKDSAVYVSGGGTYSLEDNSYREHLEYCSAREWEGNDFAFTVSINADTLIQSGVEKVESAGVNRINIEKYIRINN